MTILDIPYVSQEDEGAHLQSGKEIYNDCGPTCGTMLIRAYTPDKTFTVNQFYKEMGVRDNDFRNNDDIKKVLEKHGISSKWLPSLKISHLETFIDEKRPPITLIDYRRLRENGIKTHNGSATFHFVVLVGIDDGYVYVNDPLWPGTKGKNLKIPRDIWMKAWGFNPKNKFGNTPFQALIPTHPVDAKEMKLPEGAIRMKVVFDDFMNVRSGPGVNNKRKDYQISSGAYVTILETKKMGDDVWGKLSEDEWIAILLDGKTYLEPVTPVVDDPGDKSTIDQKEELGEEIKMSDKKIVTDSDQSTDGMLETADQSSLAEIMAELKEIKAMLTAMKKIMASGNLGIQGQTDDEQILDGPVSTTPEEPEIPGTPEEPEVPETPETPETPEEPVVRSVEVYTDRKNGQVYLSFIYKRKDKTKIPEYQFYPGDSKPVAKRVFVASGTKLTVIPDSLEVGDAGRAGWKLDKNEWFPHKGAAIPVGIDLYIEEKFIKSKYDPDGNKMD